MNWKHYRSHGLWRTWVGFNWRCTVKMLANGSGYVWWARRLGRGATVIAGECERLDHAKRACKAVAEALHTGIRP